MTDQFADIVESLTVPGQVGLFVQKRDLRISCLNVFVAKKISNSLEALLVQVDTRLLSAIMDWPQSEGFEISLKPVEGRVGELTLICLELTSSRFRDVFMSLAEDICKVISMEADAGNATEKMHIRLYRWQEFLTRHREEGLSSDQRAGLFGELEILQSVFLKTLDPALAVRGWRGCKKAHQDFQYPSLALEVKTTRAVTPDSVYISNIQQLDEEGVDEMFLSLVWVHQNESSGASLPELIADIRSSLSGQAEAMFNEGLIEVGYLESHKSKYENELYQIREISIFSVENEFPRVTRDLIPNGVKGVNYQISIDACRAFLMKPEEFQSVISCLKERLQNG